MYNSAMTNTRTSNLQLGMHEWSVLNDTSFVADANTSEPFVIPVAELEELHPKLPIALRAAIARNELLEPPKSSASGAEAFYTLLLLRNEPVKLVDANGNEQNYVSILTFKVDSGLPHSASLFGIVVDVETIDHMGQPVPFVAGWSGFQSCVLKEELDKQFPGWENRLSAGDELGLTGAELSAYALTRHDHDATVNPHMPDLAFD